MATAGRTPAQRQANALRRLAATQRRIQAAAEDHHAAYLEARSLGGTYSQIAATLGVSRQAIREYDLRWVRGKVKVPSPGPTLFD